MKSHMLITAVLFCFSSSVVFAAPIIQNISQTSNTITIAGSGFGTKATVSPVVWDDFNAGTNGSVVNLNGWVPDAGNSPTYSSTRAHSGGVSARTQFIGVNNYNSSVVRSIGSLSTLYYSYWVYVERLSGVASRNIKLTRVSSSGGSDIIHSNPNIGVTLFGDNDNPAYYVATGDSSSISYYDPRADGSRPAAVGRWMKVEHYVKLSSSPGVADGTIQTFLDGYQIKNSTGNVTLGSPSSGDTFRNLTLSFYVAHDAGGDYYIYNDDVYLDNTRARVELCPNPAWSSRGQCETQIPTAWNPNGSSITVNVNQGQFSGNTSAYLYVVNSDGTVNTTGYPVTINFGSSPIQAPKGLKGTAVK